MLDEKVESRALEMEQTLINKKIIIMVTSASILQNYKMKVFFCCNIRVIQLENVGNKN